MFSPKFLLLVLLSWTSEAAEPITWTSQAAEPITPSHLASCFASDQRSSAYSPLILGEGQDRGALDLWSLAKQEVIVRPGESIQKALRKVREWRRTGDPRAADSVFITLTPGRHRLEQPIVVRPEDSGTPTAPTIIRGLPGAVICGDTPARSEHVWPLEGFARIKDFDASRRVITIPCDSLLMKRISATRDAGVLQMVLCQRWAVAILRVKEIKCQGAVAEVSFLEPESTLEFEHPWPQPVVGGERGNSPFFLRVAERHKGLEQLLVIAGTEETPVSNLCIEGIAFEDACWSRPIEKGHVALQGGFPLVEAYKLKEEGLPWDARLENQAWTERPVSAVSVAWATGVVFRQCSFRNLRSTALDFVLGVSRCEVSESTFSHIGGSAVMVGSFAESPMEVHRPYKHLARLSQDIAITRNTIADVGEEDFGAVAVNCGYVRRLRVTHNSISCTPYSAICVGWGWTSHDTGMEHNEISHNTITHYARLLTDGGAVYTLSRQPKSRIAHNAIGHHELSAWATNNRIFPVYLDAHSDGFTLEGNTYGGRPLQWSEVGTNQPGKHIIFK